MRPGEPATLGEWRKLFIVLAGIDSPAVRMLDAKIAIQGEDELVLADSSQMLALLMADIKE
jgi:hypothetical protein